MNKSEQIKDLAAALSKAQGEFSKVLKNSKSHYGKYANMEDLVEAVTPALVANGLSYAQLPYREESMLGVETILMHSSGQFISGGFCGAPDNQTPHKVGALITYYRRYSLLAILGVAPSDDDDATEAQSHSERQHNGHNGDFNFKGQPGDFIITFGKFDGKKLKELTEKDLLATAKYWTDLAQKNNRPLDGKPAELLKQIKLYLGK